MPQLCAKSDELLRRGQKCDLGEGGVTFWSSRDVFPYLSHLKVTSLFEAMNYKCAAQKSYYGRERQVCCSNEFVFFMASSVAMNYGRA